MTYYSSKCRLCHQLCEWIPCPTGGWWAHKVHPADSHDADVEWQPMEHMDDDGEWVTQ